MSHSAFLPGCMLENVSRAVAVDVWGEQVVLALAPSSVQVLQVSPASEEKQVYRVVASKDNLGGSITQLCVLAPQSVLLCRVDAIVKVLDLPSLSLRGQLDSTKGCLLFQVNISRQLVHADERSAPGGATSSMRDMASTVDVSSVTDNSNKMVLCCVAQRRKLHVFRWEQRFFRPHTEVPIDHSAKALHFVTDTLVCVATSRAYLLVNLDASSAGAPTEVALIGRKAPPMIVGLPRRQMLLVRDSSGLVVSARGETQGEITWAEPPTAVTYYHPYVIAALPNIIEIQNLQTRTLVQTFRLKGGKFAASSVDTVVVASPSTVKGLIPLPIAQQIDELVVARSNFKEAMALVSDTVPRTDEAWEKMKDEKMTYCQLMYAYHLFNEAQYDAAMMYFQQADCNPRRILALFPAVLPAGQCKGVKHPVRVRAIAGEDNLLQALSSLIPYLAQFRSRLMLSKSKSGRTFQQVAADDDIVILDETKTTADGSKKKRNEMPLPVLIDTVLLKAYLLTDDRLVMPFLSQRNECDIEECQSILRAYEKHAELVVLYQSRGAHRNALELLATLGQGSDDMHPLHGTEETVKYLQALSEEPEHSELVFEFSKWVLKADPDQGLTIFTHAHTASRAIKSMSPDWVLSHLKKASDTEVCIAYLESLIQHCHETEPTFHNELILLYLDSILKLMGDEKKTQAPSDERVPAGEERGRLGILRSRLLEFLNSSEYYQPQKMLSKFPRDLLEERAILLSRVHQHQQALEIYAHRLLDYEKAERYCEQVFEQDPADGRDVYLSLLRVYLQPPDGSEPRVRPALELLSRHYDRIDPAKALNLLPTSTSIVELLPFFNAVLCRYRQMHRDNQIVRHLRRAENLQVRADYLETRRGRVVVRHETNCDACGKIIGKSAFARFPNGVIVHYICQDDRTVCPVTGQRFSSSRSNKK